MTDELKQSLIKIIDYLYQTNHNKEQVLAITTPLKTTQQIDKMMNWLQQNKQSTVKEQVKEALRISREED